MLGVNRGQLLHLATSLVVVEVHGCPSVLPGLQGVHELFGDGLAEANVVAAAAPQPAMTAWEEKTVSVLRRIVRSGRFMSRLREFPDLVVRFCCRRSRSCQSLPDCSSWLGCT